MELSGNYAAEMVVQIEQRSEEFASSMGQRESIRFEIGSDSTI
jgi:hypothetical protein